MVSDDGGATIGLEGRLSRIEAIVERLEHDDLELDEALELFEEGIEHVRAARRSLSTAELRIERLVDDGADGETRTEAVERDEA
ncbi:MAG: exodeoxyribonuclease VII small subunit [Gemmatimonadota bacterium]